jgi:hypothetical protein
MSYFFEGALKAFGYEVIESEAMRGFVHLLATTSSK